MVGTAQAQENKEIDVVRTYDLIIEKYAPKYGPYAESVLLYLARLARGGKGACYPSVKTIATACHMGTTKVNEVLNKLEEDGLIKVDSRIVTSETKKGRYTGKTSNVYVLNFLIYRGRSDDRHTLNTQQSDNRNTAIGDNRQTAIRTDNSRRGCSPPRVDELDKTLTSETGTSEESKVTQAPAPPAPHTPKPDPLFAVLSTVCGNNRGRIDEAFSSLKNQSVTPQEVKDWHREVWQPQWPDPTNAPQPSQVEKGVALRRQKAIDATRVREASQRATREMVRRQQQAAAESAKNRPAVEAFNAEREAQRTADEAAETQKLIEKQRNQLTHAGIDPNDLGRPFPLPREEITRLIVDRAEKLYGISFGRGA